MSRPIYTDKENAIQFRAPPKTPFLDQSSSVSNNSTLRGKNKTPLPNENHYGLGKLFNRDAKDNSYSNPQAYLTTPTARVPLSGKDNNSKHNSLRGVNTKLSFNITPNGSNSKDFDDTKHTLPSLTKSTASKISSLGPSPFDTSRQRPVPSSDFDFLPSKRVTESVHRDNISAKNEIVFESHDVLMRDDEPTVSTEARDYDDEIEYMPPKMKEVPYVPLDCVPIDYETVGKHLRERTLSGLHLMHDNPVDKNDDKNYELNTEMMMKRLPVDFVEEDIVVKEERPYFSSSPERKEPLRTSRPNSVQGRAERASKLKLRSIQSEFPPTSIKSLPHFMTATKSAELKQAPRSSKSSVGSTTNKSAYFQNLPPLPRHRLTRDVIHKPVNQKRSNLSVYAKDTNINDIEHIESVRFLARNTVEFTSDDDKMFHFEV
ncbi:hypothetical protein NADFUDRAFT_42917 [Nadsonia fulvescens var. elongata DSM 6958]|uniref:Uncharacterized protein n=1 Tax=Nadsonia fulvescens var. elongata DSM 6958 TaxID=857566 RepID=A0A1E3PH25_9ASCO|nr:hypothetical protein NADFUDRAFT_42917 [Nadsonia fulvescens var. elongata DSM 6958]